MHLRVAAFVSEPRRVGQRLAAHHRPQVLAVTVDNHLPDGAERLTALAARLGGSGVEVIWDQAWPGASRFYASDPWGNRLEFTTG